MTISRKKSFCFLNLPLQLLAAKPAKSAKYTSSAFRGKKVKTMHALTNYAKNYVSLIYQSLVAGALKSWAQEKTGGVLLSSTCIAGDGVNHPNLNGATSPV